MKDIMENWHLDRKVTLGLIAAILINAGTSVWWAASLNSQVLNQQKAIEIQGAQIAAVMASQSGIGERLAKVEAGIAYQIKILDHIEDSISKK